MLRALEVAMPNAKSAKHDVYVYGFLRNSLTAGRKGGRLV